MSTLGCQCRGGRDTRRGIAACPDSRERPPVRFDHGCLSQIQPERKAAVPVSHARDTAVTSTDEQRPGQSPACWRCSPWSRTRGSAADAATCSPSSSRSPSRARWPGPGTSARVGDHAADLPQDVLARLGGSPHPLRRRIIAPSETRIRTLIHAIGADLLDDLIGGWLRALADAGRLDGLLTAIAIDGKWLRGVLDGQVKLFAAMLHEEKVIIAQHRIPDDTTETTQVKELLDSVDLDERGRHRRRRPRPARDRAVHRGEGRGRRPGIRLLPVRQGQPAHPSSAPSSTPSRKTAPATPTTRSWTAATAGSSAAPSGSPTPATSTSRTSRSRPDPPRPLRRRRRPDQQGNRPRRHQPRRGQGQRRQPSRGSPAASGASSPCTGSVTPPTTKTPIPDTPGTAPRSWPRCGISPSACSTSPASTRSPAPSRPSHATETAYSTTSRYETQVSNDFGDPVVETRGDKQAKRGSVRWTLRQQLARAGQRCDPGCPRLPLVSARRCTSTGIHHLPPVAVMDNRVARTAPSRRLPLRLQLAHVWACPWTSTQRS